MTLGGKWETKPQEGPPPGLYDVEAAHEATRPKVVFTAIMTPELKLYTHPESVRPEVNEDHLKPMGAEIKGHITMGSKYVTKYECAPEHSTWDPHQHDPTVARVKGCHGFGGPQE